MSMDEDPKDQTIKDIDDRVNAQLQAIEEKHSVAVPVLAPPTDIVPPNDIHVTAENADEMAQCQSALIVWARAKVASMAAERDECKESYDYAVSHKWRTAPLKRHWDIAVKRFSFYEKLLAALEHGYQIVPPFPLTAFAVRTDHKNPLKLLTTSHYASHAQEAAGLPIGEGEYKNPFPAVRQRTISERTATHNEVCQYWAEHWNDFEFPVSMAKPKIMEASTRAMALKIFDELGVLPGHAPSEGTRPPLGDPMIIARIVMNHKLYALHKSVSFIIAWHLETKRL